MWELRGWSGWKLAVFPCLEILLFLSLPFLWVHPLGVYPPGRVGSLSPLPFPILRLPSPPSGFCFFFSSLSSNSRVHMVLGPLKALSLQGLWIAVPTLCTLLWVVGLRCTGAGALVCRKAGPAGNLNPNG